ncbi:type IV secretory system conjugative DNA transfer family protein [Haliscomenobacter sp.]|uniref:type IV secretory system conjugative DNA transfer family protein n=1 Tax=Haliscomenobacter sp. TaxID=2717303 RepID=UPI003BA8C894
MEFFSKIIRPGEIEELLSLIREENTIPIGKLVDIQPEVLRAFTNVWCARLDKLIQLDVDVHGAPTMITTKLKAVRGFTFDEYKALFNQHIVPEDFPYYPVFNQVNRHRGGINTEKQRLDVTMLYDFSDEGYLRILRDQGYIQALDVFVQDAIKPMAVIPIKKLFMHMYCVAPTGEGKSVLLESLMYSLQSQYQHISLVVIDPHGSLAENVKRFKLNSDRERVIYIDPFFKEGYTPTFNPFAVTDQSLMNINFAAEQFIKALDEILDREGGELSENMVNMMEKCVYFLLKREGSTFTDLLDLLSGNEQIFKEARLFDPLFDDYFLKPTNKTREALHNRISRILNSPALNNLVGGHSTFDLEAAMNSGKIIIFDLSRLGEMSQITFGKFIVASIKSIVRKRKKNCDTHTICIIDEAQNFATGSLEYILAQLRGFGLHLVLANQYPEQFESQLKAVIENTAIKIAGGGDDNIESIREIVKLKHDISLGEYEFFMKVRHKGLVKFKSPSFLIEHPQLYYMSKEEEKAFDEFQIQNYYKPLEEHVGHEVEMPVIIPPDDLKKITPPFTLIIPEE